MSGLTLMPTSRSRSLGLSSELNSSVGAGAGLNSCLLNLGLLFPPIPLRILPHEGK
jgi:hypothetical protein